MKANLPAKRINVKQLLRSHIDRGYKKLAKGTRESYQYALTEYIRITGKDIINSNSDDVFTYIKHLESKNQKQSTIARKMQGLQRIFELYVKDGLIPINIIREMKRNKDISFKTRIKRDFNISQIDIEKIKQKEFRTNIIIETLATTGLRITELINITNANIKDHISSKGNSFKDVYILGKGKRERNIKLSIPLYEKIKRVFNSDSESLFHTRQGKRLNRTCLWIQIRDVFKHHTGKVISPHLLRHYFGNLYINVLKKSVDAVSEYLGHSDPSITLKIYCHGTLEPEEIYET